MRKPTIAAGTLYLLALPGMAIVMLTSPNLPSGLLYAVFTVSCVHIGLTLGPRVGFRSLIVSQLSGQRLTGLRSGMACTAVAAILTGLFWVIPARMLIAAGLVRTALVFPESVSIGGMLWIGGVVEELTFRWCGMSLGVFFLWKWLDRASAKPGAPLYWLALVLTAALFGLAHLPHVWHTGSSAMDPFGLLQIGAAFIAGLIFGWIFWKKGLEFAMATHGLGNLAIWLFSCYR